ncbi:1,2-diacylglycerol 3-alpha-glucosyltransferase [Methylomarinovum caldicuralii]|uniref:1,2-diacylglycerol 3-alpha-glucosyltransferase n=1 Tax=Methylomarinovum caldicuralii TaxID=438856 RepID=A0AAU9BUB2_9GAMM|nr:glycosyltransferase family 4 protein [Methylomarinovum caldicuralii]BCX82256.1 1,2-diacylglycerol 3-alpha-glucosyltransferase [Methylomarinovum caldicuralii]
MICENQKIGVDIIQPIVPHYRAPLFEGLSRLHNLDLSIQCAAEWPPGDRSVAMNIADYYPKNPIKSIPGTPFVWQDNLRLIKVKKPGDVLVVCGDLHFISNWPLIWKAKQLGAGLIWWGHHWSATTNKWLYPVRLLLTRMIADCVLLYTRTGRDLYIDYGFPDNRVFFTGNTLDLAQIDNALAEVTPCNLQDFKRQHDLGENVLLFCGVLREKARLDLLLEALAQIKEFNVQLVVIGDGPYKEYYYNLAEDLGLNDSILWVGEIRSEKKLVWWYKSARIFVYPGSIGLSLMHAFAYGLPVLTHNDINNHMPEIEALRVGINGWTYEVGSIQSLTQALKKALAEEDLCSEMGDRAFRMIREEYTMEKMITRFSECILACSRMALARRC